MALPSSQPWRCPRAPVEPEPPCHGPLARCSLCLRSAVLPFSWSHYCIVASQIEKAVALFTIGFVQTVYLVSLSTLVDGSRHLATNANALHQYTEARVLALVYRFPGMHSLWIANDSFAASGPQTFPTGQVSYSVHVSHRADGDRLQQSAPVGAPRLGILPGCASFQNHCAAR